MDKKKTLRSVLRIKRQRIPGAARRSKNARIGRKLLREPCFAHAAHVALYYGVKPEVETRALLKKLIRRKKIYLPAMDPERRHLVFRRVRDLARDLKKGLGGIREPKGFCLRRPAVRMDLIVVPGVGFDRSGGRLGRGGGYYDKVLKRASGVPTIGLCFREQLVKRIPMDAKDVRVDKVLTD
ncbi:MAG: 5-formyltetrahydrofolate cyclo-ligase [Candidatus Omnitrophica bacterium]|nr:5-formyltetrahydrofolate cyclo-ligase [Candidatus Omnitrophota bacterium]